eukprot:TRINITY_DN28080_c0_g1_i1.p1 TRINITY_DN28080_c0_g1~~TRINITY_DN28080_c0_g1_i1.p1  ORF type:complete len:674 (+),score=202.51 TRINITY_DN28080_c0_g1_i1:74-2095(+)
MDVVVVAAFDDFDETLEKRQRGPGNGRKQATQALVRYLAAQTEATIGKVDLLVLDWKNPPRTGCQDISLSLHRGTGEKKGLWGSREQLLAKLAGSVWDIVICTQSKRITLDFAAQLKGRCHLALLHDYNLPFGVWGQEQTDEQLKQHAKLLQGFRLCCASRHLCSYVSTWSDSSKPSCAYAASYDYFCPAPDPPAPMNEENGYVTVVSPCPEKGLCLLARLASAMRSTRFLAIRTTAWTKPWHEQLLKRLSNVKIQDACTNLKDFLKVTKVLIMPSLGPEAFSLLAVEAQLHGIPVISTGVGGLEEANFSSSLVVKDLQLVHDPRTHQVTSGLTLEEAEQSLSAIRPGILTMPQAQQAAATQESGRKVAEESDAEPFAKVLRQFLEGGDAAIQSAADAARAAALAFIEGQRGSFLGLLSTCLEEAGDAKPAPAVAREAAPAAAIPAQHRKLLNGSPEDDDEGSFDRDQDFASQENFDGQALATRFLVRCCEQGSLSLAAELLQARADTNAAEAEVGVTPLVGAANAGHLDICKYLLRKEADVNAEVADGTGRTALHAASYMGFASVVRLLLEKRADPKLQDHTKTHPLHLAVKHGHAGAAELLLVAKANANMADDQGHVAINDAVAKDRFDLATKLLEHGALVNVRNMAGLEAISFSRTPQMQAMIMKHDVHF